jgi:hypothetical protein
MIKMSNINSISELLTLSKCQFLIYDLGRKVTQISYSDFNKVEQNQLAYPYPIQGEALFAVTFWQKRLSQQYLWFIKLPLDERGLLNQGARNHFIAIIIEALGSDLTRTPDDRETEQLKKNPYIFTPTPAKLAMLNSLISFQLEKEPSQYYQPFIDYLSNQHWQDWQHIGLQGITDVSARINDAHNQCAPLLISALAHLPAEVLSPLTTALENMNLPCQLTEQLIDQYHHLNTSNQESKKGLLIRALASSFEQPQVNAFFITLLANTKLSNDSLIVLAARCWPMLNSFGRLMLYFEQLVGSNEQTLFPAIFKDLVAIPNLRPLVFQIMKAENKSNALSLAISRLFDTPSN